METKNARVRRLVSYGEYKSALQICKDWNYENPTHREKLRLGYECLLYPRFYQQLGYNPEQAYQESIEILKLVYAESPS